MNFESSMLSEIGQLQGHINPAGFYFCEVPKGLNPQGQKQWGSPWTGGGEWEVALAYWAQSLSFARWKSSPVCLHSRVKVPSLLNGALKHG